MKRFNIRVYGIYIEDNKLLVTDELRLGIKMTKLPGGGLKYHEGFENGLKREWREELDVNIEIGDVFYVNPFLQISAFNVNEEVICVYFWITKCDPIKVEFKHKPMDFASEEDGQQIFRWIPLSQVDEQTFTFPIDKALASKLKNHFQLMRQQIADEK